MTIDQAVVKFDKLLDEVTTSMPMVLLDDGTVCYEKYAVKRNSKGLWELAQIGKKHRNVLGAFYVRANALITARYHKKNDIMGMAKIKDLDQRYWHNHSDSVIFIKLYKNTKDDVKKDVFYWRWEQSKERAEKYRQQITYAFSSAFR